MLTYANRRDVLALGFSLDTEQPCQQAYTFLAEAPGFIN